MFSLRSLLLFPILLLLSASVLAESYIHGGGLGDGPHSVPLARFNELMASPNLSSKYPIPAPDTSLPYPSTAPAISPGWTWGISVVADISITVTNSSTAWDLKNQTFTATKVVLEAPHEANTNTTAMDAPWQLCVLSLAINTTSFPDRARQDDGTCSSILTERCRRGVETQAAQRYRSSQSRQCNCPDYDKLPEWCSSEEVGFLKAGGVCIVRRRSPPPRAEFTINTPAYYTVLDPDE
jgi:hypothetical protein